MFSIEWDEVRERFGASSRHAHNAMP